ncbi:PorP/SprF family type IX secretion system membrane protein [Flavobacterium sp.]|uniref:PorP/SprF family type IX secretion system membrane protein n=1 Tax=Flavobacterium sp. TaxID=239 RepID=UPI003F6A1419
MRTKLLLLVLLLSGIDMYSQQDSQFTQYMYNTININPAYAGSRGVMSVFGLYRNQWVGLDGAPVTMAGSFNTPIANSNIGLGLSVLKDEIGPSDETSVSADISYSIPTSERFKLSFGVKATANLLNIDFTKLNIYNPTDPRFQNSVDNRFSPNVGAGLYFHSDKTYLGLSVPNILETKHFDQSSTSNSASFVATERMHYYFIAGHVFDLSPSLQFKPAVLTKMVQGAPLQVDVSGNFLINEKLTLGVAYRWDAAVSAMAGFQVNDSWFIGYGYDLETTKLGNYNSGSHEIFLRYELFQNYDRVISPRFF